MSNFFKKSPPSPVELEIETRIKELAIPFGSQVWGGATKKSDYDFIMTHVNYAIIRNLLSINKIKYRSGRRYDTALGADHSIRVTLNNRKYEFIIFTYSNSCNNVVQAINLMTDYVKAPLIHKSDRYKICANFLHFTKTQTLTADAAINDYLKDNHSELFI